MTFDIGIWGAAFAGLLSFLSPCILPIVPFYLCYMAGQSLQELTGGAGTGAGAAGDAAAGDARALRRRAAVAALLFSAGVITIFVGLGASATAFGQQLRDWFGVIRWIAAALIAAMGLHFLGLLNIGPLHRQARFDPGAGARGPLGAYVIGLAFAFGWTPCVGPVLATILFAASEAETAARGARLLLAYGMGMTLPFVLAALFIGPFQRWARRFRRHLGLVQRGMGAALILFAALIATNSMSVIAQWMLSVAPDIGVLR